MSAPALTSEQYHADPAAAPSLSYGTAKRLITQSPLHAWFHHPRLNPDYRAEYSDEFDAGSLAHSLLFEAGANICPIDADDWRTKAAKEARDEARRNGLIPVLARKLEPVRRMADVARAFLAESELRVDLSTGDAEHSILWERDGTHFRARLDWLSADRTIILDYKTTAGTAQPSAWIRSQMASLHYDMQAVHYSDAVRAQYGTSPAFVFLVQENYEPFACSLVALHESMIDVARAKMDEATRIWQACLRANRWPAYTSRIHYAMPSAWQMAEHEERINTDDDDRPTLRELIELGGQA